MGRILGLDYGHRRIGVAISDPLGLIAQPLETWNRYTDQQVIARITELIETFMVELIVLGYPLTLRGDKSRSTKRVERFRDMLVSRIHIGVELIDERLTSVQAERIMHDMNIKPSQHKAQVDMRAAALLLQVFLDQNRLPDEATAKAAD